MEITFDAQSPSIGTRRKPCVMKIACGDVVAPVPYVGCLTARRRNDPKQAGLSNQCPAARTVRRNASSDERSCGPLPSGWVLMMRAIKCLKGIRWMPWR
jgi:hypothetical protein